MTYINVNDIEQMIEDGRIKHIYLDFDCTMVDSITAVLSQLNERYGTSYIASDCTTWNFSNLFPNLSEVELLEIFDSVRFCDEVKMYEGVYEFIIKHLEIITVVSNRLETNLRGLVLDSSGNKTLSGEPLMNNKGIKDVMMVMRSFGDRASVMSFYNTNEIKMLMEMLNDTLSKLLMLNFHNYGFVNPAGRDLVVFMCNASGFAIIKRGYEGGERRFWKGSQLEYSVKTNQERRGMFSGLFGSKKF
jgi:hypothetical protein